jgi:aminopeptidase-like protein
LADLPIPAGMAQSITPAVGDEIYALAARIFPICRSITGDGVRETIKILRDYIPLEIHEIASGTQVFDWTIPREWNIRDAYIKDSDGRRVVDFRKSNLHVVSYSQPVHAPMTLDELRPHLHTLPDKPDLIPYRTSYYANQWGFCLAHRELERLANGTYDVVIDSEFKDGSLTWGEYVHRGETDGEVLLYAHICHPSLANENCSGLALLTILARSLATRKTRYTYRLVFAPATIGAIAWLARNQMSASRIKRGLIVSSVGDGGGPSYKRSRQGNAVVDRTVCHVLKHSGLESNIIDFSPDGYSERQFCSPGFNLPVGLFERSSFGKFREYHTSADNLDFITAQNLGVSYGIISSIVDVMEHDQVYVNLYPKCEPQLGRRGLYRSYGNDADQKSLQQAMLWVLNQADGTQSTLDIAEKSGLPHSSIRLAADKLTTAGLIRPCQNGAE